MVKSKSIACVGSIKGLFTNIHDFADNSHSISILAATIYDINLWIIDTGATDHMSPTKYYFDSLTFLLTPTLVHLPNGTTTKVSHNGNITLNSNLTLQNVLYILNF